MNDLAAITASIADESGIRVPHDRIEAAIARIAAEDAGADGEREGEMLVGRLIEALTVKESYFLRQPEDLRVLDWSQLLARAVADGRRRLRVWSAACANGEEPYTLALLASDAFGSAPPPVDILGTDIAATALEFAAAGVYGERAVRNLSAEARERFFESRGPSSTINPRLRDLVMFKRHNLARDPMPPLGEAPFDLVVCRNVLIYFEPFALEHFVRMLPRALVPGGKLVLGAADRLCLSQSSLRDLRSHLGATPAPAAPFTREGRPRSQRGAAAREHPIRAGEARPSRDMTDPVLAGALRLADAGEVDEATAVAASIVRADPMNAPAQFVLGTLRLASGEAPGAVEALRSALYSDPGLVVAAFQLGRAHDVLGETAAARRAYRRALERLEAGASPYPWLLEDIDEADIAVACAARLNRG